MDTDFVVVVGDDFAEDNFPIGEAIFQTLDDHGVDVVTWNGVRWPRDHYVYFQNNYVKSYFPGKIEGNAFGEGGFIQTDDSVLLISDSVYLNDGVNKHIVDRRNYEDVKAGIWHEGYKHHPNARIYIAPSGKFHGSRRIPRYGNVHGHIDMYTLLLSKEKLLLIDTFWGGSAQRVEMYEEFAKEEEFKIIEYDGNQDGVWYPLNSLVIPTNYDNSTVVIDKMSVSLEQQLCENGVHVISVEMPYMDFPSGKINCKTNIIKKEHIHLLDSFRGIVDQYI